MVFTPINLDSEKKKFFASETYNPQFKYKLINNNNESILKELLAVEEISDVDPRLSEFYIKLIQAKREASDLMHVVGNNEAVSYLSKKRFRMPSDKLFRNACRVLRGKYDAYELLITKKVDRGEYLQYEEIKRIFEAVFAELGMDNWSIIKSNNIAKNGIKVGVKNRTVLVDENIERSKFKLRKTIVHEVGTHALRAYNGFRSGFEALGKSNIPSYLDIEEGLATWNEYELGLLTSDWLRNKAALVWGIYIGEELTFRELYNSALAVLPKKAAFDLTYRVKRGLSDTSMPGIYAKDVAYFRGFRKIMKKLDKDPAIYDLLYAGKIDIKQTKWVLDGLIKKPEIIPTPERWEQIFKKVGI
jgi:hypothetical protein